MRPSAVHALAAALGFVMAFASSAMAQTVDLQVEDGPHYVGVPIAISVVAEGFEEDPAPQPIAPQPSGARLVFRGAQPKVSSRITIINGQMTQTRTVRFVFRYELRPDRRGTYSVGPFVVRQGSVERSTPTVTLRVGELAPTQAMTVDVELPETPVYPGERVSVVVQWTFPAALQPNLDSYAIRVPLFDDTDAFQFIDARRTTGSSIEIRTRDGAIELNSQVAKYTEKGESRILVRAERTMVPLAPGEYDVAPASVLVEEVTHWSRGSFGRTPQATRKLRAVGTPRRLVVRALPAKGRPESFAGAVGRGFLLEVEADRSVVQVGDPITLTFTVRGEGNLVGAGAPVLSSREAAMVGRFKLPAEQSTGEMVEGAKRFTAVVRPLDAEIREIPPIAYSYFDSSEGAYATVRSQPIALAVRPATIVGSDDVIGGAPEVEAPTATSPAKSVPSLAFALRGAELSIVTDVARLARAPAPGTRRGVFVALLYAAALVLVGLAVVLRARAEADPAIAARRAAISAERARLDRARSAPVADAAREIATALRNLVRASGGSFPGLNGFIAECEAIQYAPDTPGRTLPDDFFERALAWAETLREGA